MKAYTIMSRLFPTPQKPKRERNSRESLRKISTVCSTFDLSGRGTHKSFYFDTIAVFQQCFLPFGTFSPYLQPKLFTIDPHFLNHKITKRRALMFALWTSLVKCPKVHKSLTEKRGVFPNILAWLEATQKVTWKTGK